MTKHAELIARLEAAEVGDWDLSLAVWLASGATDGGWDCGAAKHVALGHVSLGYGNAAICAPVAISLDAALALAERLFAGRPFKWRMRKRLGKVRSYSVNLVFDNGERIGFSKTPAIALCVAILRALDND